MFLVNLKMALASIRSSKIRSILTMLGVIIGVMSVVTIVSLGNGLVGAVEDQVSEFGADLVQVNPGDFIIRDENGDVESFNPAALFSNERLDEDDLAIIRQTEGVSLAVPLATLVRDVSFLDQTIQKSTIIATEPELLSILGQEIEDGQFITPDIRNPRSIVLGHGIANTLFSDGAAIGRSIKIQNKDFTVIGVLAEYESALSGLGFGPDFNDIIYTPLTALEEFGEEGVFFNEIDFRVDDATRLDETINRVDTALLEARGGERDFTVSKPAEFLDVITSVLNQVTIGVTAIALISVLVGGIGIMNIMFVSVTERTREIGIRKSIGATNAQILWQFLIESIVISIIGALIGIGLALGIGLGVQLATDFSPQLSPTFLGIVVASSIAVGVTSGLAPAMNAARKNPIEALRHE